LAEALAKHYVAFACSVGYHRRTLGHCSDRLSAYKRTFYFFLILLCPPHIFGKHQALLSSHSNHIANSRYTDLAFSNHHLLFCPRFCHESLQQYQPASHPRGIVSANVSAGPLHSWALKHHDCRQSGPQWEHDYLHSADVPIWFGYALEAVFVSIERLASGILQ
jgi:hypothetical protein